MTLIFIVRLTVLKLFQIQNKKSQLKSHLFNPRSPSSSLPAILALTLFSGTCRRILLFDKIKFWEVAPSELDENKEILFDS